MTGCRPMTLADLGGYLVREVDGRTRWKLVWEFLEEYRWEPGDIQPLLLTDEPSPTGDERWDTLLAALAEHLAAQHDLAPRAHAAFHGELIIAEHGTRPVAHRSGGMSAADSDTRPRCRYQRFGGLSYAILRLCVLWFGRACFRRRPR